MKRADMDEDGIVDLQDLVRVRNQLAEVEKEN